MTDRIAYLSVVLDGDYRDDDVKPIVKAIKMIRGVGSVSLGPAVTGDDHLNRLRIKGDVLTLMYKFMGLALGGRNLDADQQRWEQIKKLLEDAFE